MSGASGETAAEIIACVLAVFSVIIPIAWKMSELPSDRRRRVVRSRRNVVKH